MNHITLNELRQLRNELSQKVQNAKSDYDRTFFITQHNLVISLINKIS